MKQTKTSYRVRMRALIATAAVAIGVAACGGNDDPVDPGPGDETVSFTVAANQQQEVPATGSDATANGTLTLNTTSGALSGSVTASGVTVQMAHIHDGFAGSNGPVIVGLDVSGDTFTVPDNTVLTADQIASMQAGGYYVNVHSTAFPAGEIRGQVTPPGVQVIVTALTGDQEVPSSGSSGSGSAYLTVNETSGVATIAVRTTGLASPTMAHLHNGSAGTNGPVLLGLTQNAAEIDQFDTPAASAIDSDGLAALLAGNTYINVHTEAVPSGELRGQVLPQGISLLLSALTGDQEVPALASTASGTGYVTVNANTDTVSAVVNAVGADDAVMAHIHTGAFGVNGPVLIGLTQDASNAGSWSVVDASTDAAGIAALQSSGTYFNVHTPANPSGEIRGQILPQ